MVAQVVKNLRARQKTQVQSLGWEDPLEKEMAILVFLPGESHGQRSLVGYSPWGHKESDLTERLTLSGDGGDSFTNTRKSIGTRPCSGPYAEGKEVSSTSASV